ncbi:hypothetical protein HYH02_008906 [Chlamydomonas schloesseri]|uniref:Uncharacterized protein n=1 Tax=Chlamydomonas schloesseri TaxID=2026947 RepID=A0A835WCT5_9CHLO|nr:hypothetical protein HYH02_008906 [Chlamydomonas schloesseri]|eukprot:KAG2445038.1 hypothetical protein HYH02_008906 [Chlamydomonas schloesseri]
MDAVNQLPHYLVRGEQGGAFHHLWLAARQLATGMRKSRDYTRAVEQLAAERRQEQAQAQAQEDGRQGRGGSGRRRGRRALQQPQQEKRHRQGEGREGAEGSRGQQEQEQEQEQALVASEGFSGGRRQRTLQDQRQRQHQHQYQRQHQHQPEIRQAAGLGVLRQGVGGGRRRLVGAEESEGVSGASRALQRQQAAEGADAAGQAAGWDESRLDFGTVKAIYDQHAPLKKLPWFNDFHPRRLTDAARAFYAHLYAYGGQQGAAGGGAPAGGQQAELVSGFKEIRFVSGRCFASGSPYSDFEAFLNFLRSLCVDVKFLLNSRAGADLEANKKLAGMLRRFGHSVTADQLQADLLTTHDWYDRYTAEHPDHALRVLMEHMFSEQEKLGLSERILRFLGEDPGQLPPLRFDRMPSWGARTKGARGQEDEDGEEEDEDGEELDGNGVSEEATG